MMVGYDVSGKLEMGVPNGSIGSAARYRVQCLRGRELGHEVEIATSTAERIAFVGGFWKRALENVSLLDATSPELAERGYRNWVWDAAAMPAGGHYFPVYAHLLATLEARGEIIPGRSVLAETTTGTAGMALGWLAARLGYRVILFMPEDMPVARIDAVRANLSPDSRLIFTPAGGYVGGMVHEFQRFLVNERRRGASEQIFALDHSRRPEAVEALRTIIATVLSKVPDPASLEYAVGALGNGTSSSALFQAARAVSPGITRVGVEPIEAPVAFVRKYGQERFEAMFGQRSDPGPHQLLGTGGWGVRFPHLDTAAVDEIIPLHSDRWREEQRQARERGLDLGNSSAACQAAITALARRRPQPFSSISIRYDLSSVY